jgi:tRNA U34 5-methylaminomethyl-2-thiouridine-forming methyltransferase MnmC
MKKHSPNIRQKPYWEMAAAELAKATEDFNREGTILRTSSLNRKMRNRWAKAGKRGRPRMGKGSKRVLISMEKGLLQRTDELARRRGIARSELIAEGLETILAKAS